MPEQIPEWAPEDVDVIAAELIACTLGQRRRPELRIDLAGRMARLRLDVQWDVVRRAFDTTARAAAQLRRDLARIRPEDTQP